MRSRTVLVVGSGAREHAIAWACARSKDLKKLILLLGSDAMQIAADAPFVLERWKSEPWPQIARRARDEGVSLVIIGPDQALADGAVDAFNKEGVLALGPTRDAAQLEWSKKFAKDIMQEAGVPTAEFRSFTDQQEALRFIRSVPWGAGWVIKTDGLALGKGVRVCGQLTEAESAIQELTGPWVIERRLEGRESSWIALCDGERAAVFPPARDYKRLGDYDKGPNTGGMGAVSPLEEFKDGVLCACVRSRVFDPVLKLMRERGTPFKGFLYAGLMVAEDGREFWVLEFNARLGDPEAQVLLPRMNADFLALAEQAARGELPQDLLSIPSIEEHAVYVVGASPGYPESVKSGMAITGLPLEPLGTSARPAGFVAGAREQNPGQWVTSGGRVFGVLGWGASLEAARGDAYKKMSAIQSPGLQFRTDIGS